MKIGELADRTGVPPRMLRYYEQQGLLSSERESNGYRSYADEAVDRVLRVRSLIRSGVPTKLIAPILDREAGVEGWTDACTADLAQELTDELRSIQDRIACLELSRSTITDCLADAGRSAR